MANNIGTLVTSPIRPQGELDKYPVAIANEIQGGHHQVSRLADRDAIPEERRLIGMTCYVQEVNITFQLLGGLTNLCWQLYNSGGNGSGSVPYIFVDEEFPLQDTIDSRLYVLQFIPITGSLKVYQEGIRLRIGSENDYIMVTPNSFRINDVRDFEPDDTIIADYRVML